MCEQFLYSQRIKYFNIITKFIFAPHKVRYKKKDTQSQLMSCKVKGDFPRKQHPQQHQQQLHFINVGAYLKTLLIFLVVMSSLRVRERKRYNLIVEKDYDRKKKLQWALQSFNKTKKQNPTAHCPHFTSQVNVNSIHEGEEKVDMLAKEKSMRLLHYVALNSSWFEFSSKPLAASTLYFRSLL